MALTGDCNMESNHPNPDGHREYMEHLFHDSAGGATAFNTADGRKPAGDADVVLAVDTSESARPQLRVLRQQLAQVLDSAVERANSIRFALVSFREDPRFSGDPVDYTSRLEQDFTYEPTEIIAAAQRLRAAGGGGDAETMFSGLMTALELRWREGVKKSAIVVSDNGPHALEPFTDISIKDVIDKAWSVDPAAISVVDTGNASASPALQRVVDDTSGRIFVAPSPDETAEVLQVAIDDTSTGHTPGSPTPPSPRWTPPSSSTVPALTPRPGRSFPTGGTTTATASLMR